MPKDIHLAVYVIHNEKDEQYRTKRGEIMSKINSNKDKRIEEEFNSETQKSINDVEKWIGLSKEYTNLDDMWRDLEK